MRGLAALALAGLLAACGVKNDPVPPSEAGRAAPSGDPSAPDSAPDPVEPRPERMYP